MPPAPNYPAHREEEAVRPARRSALLVVFLQLAFVSRSAPDLRGFQTVLAQTLFERLQAEAQAQADHYLAGGQAPGVTAGIVLPDGRSFAVAAGVSNRATGAPMKTTDRLMQGSVGKTYVAAVALQLVTEGRLNLDDRIEKHLGEESWFPRLPNGKDITVRMLMNHTSGLVRYEFKEQFTKDLTAAPDKVWNPEELVAYILDSPAPFPAGRDWEYSDTNYIVLGMILEKVTGDKYHRLVRQRVLIPNGLMDTIPVEGRVVAWLVPGYAGPANPFGKTDEMIRGGKFVINPQFEWTGGGMASTSEDLAKWAKLLYEGKAFDPSLMPEFLDGVPAKLGPNTRYGLGVIIRETHLGTSYGHSGFFPGYLTEMMYFPRYGIAVAAQVNTSETQKLGTPLGRFLLDLAASMVTGPR